MCRTGKESKKNKMENLKKGLGEAYWELLTGLSLVNLQPPRSLPRLRRLSFCADRAASPAQPIARRTPAQSRFSLRLAFLIQLL